MNRLPDYEHTQPGTLIRIAVGMVFAVLCTLAVMRGLGGDPAALAIHIGICVISFAVLMCFHSLTVTVSKEDLSLAFGVGFVSKKVPMANIVSATIVKNPWYYGWGIKLIPGGWLFNVSGFDAVELALENSKKIRVGTDQPDQLLEAIEKARGNQH